MRATHIIVIEPVGGQHYADVFIAKLGNEQLAISRTPLLAAARELICRGYSPTDRLVMRHKGSDTDCLTASIRAAAKLTVTESNYGPRFGPWVEPKNRFSRRDSDGC